MSGSHLYARVSLIYMHVYPYIGSYVWSLIAGYFVHALVRHVSAWSFKLDMDRCLTWSTDVTDVWHGSSIYLMHDMIVSSVWCMTWSCHLPYAWPGRLFCHMFNSFTRAINHWYIQCMLSIYDMQPIIDVAGVRDDRWGALIRWSLHDVRWRRWLWWWWRYTAPVFSVRIFSWMHGGCYDRS